MLDESPKTIYVVEWMDAHYNTDEVAVADVYHSPWKYTTVGLLLKSNEIGVTVASDVGQDGKVRGVNFIPRGMVIHEYTGGTVRRRSKRGRKTGVSHEKEAPAVCDPGPGDPGPGL